MQKLGNDLAGFDERWPKITQKVAKLACTVRDNLLITTNQAVIGERRPVESQIPDNLGTTGEQRQDSPSRFQDLVPDLIDNTVWHLVSNWE